MLPTSDPTPLAKAAEAYRHQLHLHCYRMLGSFQDAEDIVQEACLRAWRTNPDLSELGNPRAWLYRVATNLCLDSIKSKRRRAETLASFRDLPWLEPYPDHILDRSQVAAAATQEPGEAVVARETIELAYVAVIQSLPPAQRAALVLRDVLGWPAADIAETLDRSIAAVNSLLQRARATLRGRLPRKERGAWVAHSTTRAERLLLDRFIRAHESGDLAATLELVAEYIRVTMPPAPYVFEGTADMATLVARAKATGAWRLQPVFANRQPAAACYLRREGESTFSAYKIDVLHVVGGKIAEITTFGVKHFDAFKLPPALNGDNLGE